MVDILIKLLYLLPFFDAINGFMVRRYSFYGVGSYFHLLLLLITGFIIVSSKKIVAGKFEKLTGLLIFGFVVSMLIAELSGELITSISIERIEKIICTAVFISCFTRMAICEKIKSDSFRKLIEYQCTVIPLITIFSDLTGLYNSSYTTSNNGRIGFYTNLNEATLVMLIIMLFLVKKMTEKIKAKDVACFICSLGCLILTESKTGVVIGILFVLLFLTRQFWVNLVLTHKLKKRSLLYMGVGLPVGIIVLIKSYKTMINSFMRRQVHMYNSFSGNGMLSFLTSGRIERIQLLILNPLGEYFVRNPLVGLIRMFFGFGLANDYYATMEMDFFDCILYGGLFVGLIWFMYNVYIWKYIKSGQNNKLIVIYVTIIMLASVFMGHIWTGGVCGIYFALMIAYLGFSTERDKRRANR